MENPRRIETKTKYRDSLHQAEKRSFHSLAPTPFPFTPLKDQINPQAGPPVTAAICSYTDHSSGFPSQSALYNTLGGCPLGHSLLDYLLLMVGWAPSSVPLGFLRVGLSGLRIEPMSVTSESCPDSTDPQQAIGMA